MPSWMTWALAVTSSPVAPLVDIATTSPPAQKAGPAASRITAVIPGSSATRWAISRQRSAIAKSIAFSRAGRLNLMRARPSSETAKRMLSSAAVLSWGAVIAGPSGSRRRGGSFRR